jgi:hypothetical protein
MVKAEKEKRKDNHGSQKISIVLYAKLKLFFSLFP